jgi:uncharacterized membrane protein
VTLRRIGQVGWALFAVWAGVLITWAIVEPDPYAGGWRLVLELAFMGHLVSIADGSASGFGKAYLFVQSGMQDAILLMVAYPIVVSAYEGVVTRGGVAGRWLAAVHRAAERQKRVVEPAGAIGLWVFVVLPFWSTGTLVGGMVGYLLGMRTSVVFAAVLSGYVLSVIGLIWFFDFMTELAAVVDIGLVRYAPWIVVVVFFGGSFLYQRLRAGRAA